MRMQPRAPLHITCPRYGVTPNLGERPCSGKQRRCPLRPKVRPDERPCNNLCASQRQMAMPTDEEALRREPQTGATAIPRVDYGGESHCASPTTSEALPSRNDVIDHRHRIAVVNERSARMADRHLPEAQRLRRV